MAVGVVMRIMAAWVVASALVRVVDGVVVMVVVIVQVY